MVHRQFISLIPTEKIIHEKFVFYDEGVMLDKHSSELQSVESTALRQVIPSRFINF
jgi:hypothetical protein